MNNRRSILVAAVMLTAGVAAPGLSAVPWPVEHLAAVAGTPVRAELGDEWDVRTKLEHCAAVVPGLQGHLALAAAVADRKDATAVVILEACFPDLRSGGTGYSGVAAVQSDSIGSVLLVSEARGVRTTTLAEEQWASLVGQIEGAALRGGFGPDVDDGTTYFVGWVLNGERGQFAVYSPLDPALWPFLSKSSQEYHASISKERELVRKLLALAHKEEGSKE